MLKLSSTCFLVAIAYATVGCASVPPKTPLQLAMDATGEQKRLLLEELVKKDYSNPQEVRLTAAKEALLARVQTAATSDRPRFASALAATLTADNESTLSPDLWNRVLAETRFIRCSGEFCVQRIGVPSYPAIALSAMITADVLVEFSLKDGQPQDVTTFGPPLLEPAAAETVAQFRFLPLNSPQRYHMTVAFDLEGARGTAYDYAFPDYVRISAPPPHCSHC